MMEAQMTGKMLWYVVDGPCGVDCVPADVVGEIDVTNRAACTALRDYSENDVTIDNLEDGRVTVERIVGYGVRSSMPGYMDCTPWSVYTTKREATKAYHAERRENAGEDA